MTGVTMQYLLASGDTVCTYWEGTTFTVGKIYSSNGTDFTTNYLAIPISSLENRSNSVLNCFRRAYKNELKGKLNE